MNVTCTTYTFDHNPTDWLESQGFSSDAWNDNVIIFDDGINIARVTCVSENNYVVRMMIVEE